MVRNVSQTASESGIELESQQQQRPQPHHQAAANNGRCDRRARRKRAKKCSSSGASSPEIPADWTKANKEARRCSAEAPVCSTVDNKDSNALLELGGLEVNNSSGNNLTLDNNSLAPQSLPSDFEERLRRLLELESAYHPNTESLFRINADMEDKVDANLRNEAVFNLRFLHKFYNMSPECFALAVNIADRFIVKIKVKPKYMACLATAAYLIACKMVEDPMDWPTPEKLVSVARCGGSPSDLERMEGIIRSKLSAPPMEETATPLHFLQLLQPLFPQQQQQQPGKAFQRAVGDLEICLCSAAVNAFRPAHLALGVARRYLAPGSLQPPLMSLLGITEPELRECESALEAEGRRVRIPRVPAPRALVWTLSRRTVSHLQRPSAAAQASLLDTIREDWLEEDNWDIGRLFD